MEKILVLGGTHFIGRNLVESLLRTNRYEITLFNRGIRNSQLFPELQLIKGDRESEDIQKIFNKDWDYVIDCSCYFPGSMEKIVQGINSHLKRYLFISTCSVYDNDALKMLLRNEEAPLLVCTPEQAIDPDNSSYGNRKAEAERILKESGIPYSIFRPALVYGPYDSTDRFYYWLYQLKKNYPLLLPGDGTSPFSLTYVHDLVKVLVDSLNTKQPSDAYNLISHPTASISMITNAGRKLLKSESEEFNASASFLHQEQVAEWMDLPLWLDCDYFTYDPSKIKKELDFAPSNFERSLEETIAYFEQLQWPEPKFGMSNEKKTKLIENMK